MKREPQYSLMSALAVLLVGLAALTLMPHADSQPDLMGYHTLCSFAPVSTLVLLGLAGFVLVMRNTVYEGKPPA